MKLLLDTNILIDLVANREPSARSVRTLCVAAMFGDVQLWASTQSYADAYYVLGRSSSAHEVKEALLATLEFMLPCGTAGADLKPALESDWHDIEDYLIAASTKHIKADFMITRDAEMAKNCPITAMTASEFVSYLEKEHGLSYEDIDY